MIFHKIDKEFDKYKDLISSNKSFNQIIDIEKV